jgi:hypothetical protein
VTIYLYALPSELPGAAATVGITGVSGTGYAGSIKPSVSPDLYTLVSGSAFYLATNQTYVGRTTTATYFNSSGNLTAAAVNVSRQTYDPHTLSLLGTLMEPAATNYVPNSSAVGGGSGVAPTGWLVVNVVSGITTTLIGTSSIYGITTYQVSIVGTATSNGAINIKYANNNFLTDLSYNTNLAQSIWVKLASGSLSGVQAISHWGRIFDSTGTVVKDDQPQFSPTSTFTQYVKLETTPSSGSSPFYQDAASILVYIQNGNSVNLTLAVGAAQVEIGAASTSFIPTSTGPVYRAADSYYSSPFANGTGVANSPVARDTSNISGVHATSFAAAPTLVYETYLSGAIAIGSANAVTITLPGKETGVAATGVVHTLSAKPAGVPLGTSATGIAHTTALITIGGVLFGAAATGFVGPPVTTSSETIAVGGGIGTGSASVPVATTTLLPIGVYGTGGVNITLGAHAAPSGVSGNGFAGSPIATVGGSFSGVHTTGVSGNVSFSFLLAGADAIGFVGSETLNTFPATYGVYATGEVGYLTPTDLAATIGSSGIGFAYLTTPSLSSGVYGTGFSGVVALTTNIPVVNGVSGVGEAKSIPQVITAVSGVYSTGEVGTLYNTVVVLGAAAIGWVTNPSVAYSLTLSGITSVGSAGSPSTPNQTVAPLDSLSGTGFVGTLFITETVAVNGVAATGVVNEFSLISVTDTLRTASGTGVVHVPYLSFVTTSFNVFGTGWAGTAWPSYEGSGASGTGTAGIGIGTPLGVSVGATASGEAGVVARSITYTFPSAVGIGFTGFTVPQLPHVVVGAHSTGFVGFAKSELPGGIPGVYSTGFVNLSSATGAPFGVFGTGFVEVPILTLTPNMFGTTGVGHVGQPVVLPQGIVLAPGVSGIGFTGYAIPSQVEHGVYGTGFVGVADPARTGLPSSGVYGVGSVNSIPQVGGVVVGVYASGTVISPFIWPNIVGVHGTGSIGRAAPTGIGSNYFIFSFNGEASAANPAVGSVVVTTFTSSSDVTETVYATGDISVNPLFTGTAVTTNDGIFTLPLQFSGSTSVTQTATSTFTVPLTFQSTATLTDPAVGTFVAAFTTDSSITVSQQLLSNFFTTTLGVQVTGTAQSVVSAVGSLTLEFTAIALSRGPLIAELSAQRLWTLPPT